MRVMSCHGICVLSRGPGAAGEPCCCQAACLRIRLPLSSLPVPPLESSLSLRTCPVQTLHVYSFMHSSLVMLPCAAGDDCAEAAAACDEGRHGDGSAGDTQPPKHRQVRILLLVLFACTSGMTEIGVGSAVFTQPPNRCRVGSNGRVGGCACRRGEDCVCAQLCSCAAASAAVTSERSCSRLLDHLYGVPCSPLLLLMPAGYLRACLTWWRRQVGRDGDCNISALLDSYIRLIILPADSLAE
jgi:hypothetical protein